MSISYLDEVLICQELLHLTMLPFTLRAKEILKTGLSHTSFLILHFNATLF